MPISSVRDTGLLIIVVVRGQRRREVGERVANNGLAGFWRCPTQADRLVSLARASAPGTATLACASYDHALRAARARPIPDRSVFRCINHTYQPPCLMPGT